MATPLSPAESLVLLNPNRATAREAVKVTLLSLVAQGLLRIEEGQQKRFFGMRKVVYLRPTDRRVPSLPAHMASLLDCVRAAQPLGGMMYHVVNQARRTYGAQLQRFTRQFIKPALTARGLLEERKILLFPTYRLTQAGAAERSRIESDVARAGTIPDLLKSDPAEAAAIALAVGSTILLVPTLRSHYRQLSQAMQRHDAGDNAAADGSWSVDGNSSADLHHHAPDCSNFDHATFESLDVSGFDAGAFDALDTGMASFDSGFDASAGGDGGGGDGGGDGGGGGGD